MKFLLFLSLRALLLGAVLAQAPEREYFPVTIAKLAAGNNFHTHIQVTGFVTYQANEDDGDHHIRLCDSPKVNGMNRAHCIVAERIPTLDCPGVVQQQEECPLSYWHPKIGQQITVFGISRFDGEHKWYEVHPVERVRIEK